MTGVVVDANVAVKWFFPEDDSDRALALLGAGGPFFAPDLIVFEACSVGWKKVRVGQASRKQAQSLALGLADIIDELVPGSTLSARALDIAFELDHPVYDACYIALAESYGLPLITAARRLISRVGGTRWASMVNPLT